MGRQEGAFAIPAADAQEVAVRRAVGLVDAAFVAALLQRFLRHSGCRAGAGHQHRIRTRRVHLQYLTGHRGVAAGEALVGHDFNLVGFRLFGKFTVPALAIGIGKADERHGLDAVGGHVSGDGRGHLDVVLRRLEGPLALGVHRID